MACSCGAAVTAEMLDWVKLGGGNSGCCGDSNHTYGFHCPANRVSTSDYSRRRDPAGPNGYLNASWACAGDFAHNNDPRLRAMHANVLSRLTAGDPKLSMICEFIGKPWADRPVYYWFRGDGLKRYTGAGHDRWSHISWYRSRANQRAYLWVPGGSTPESTTKAPPYPGYVIVYNPDKYDGNLKVWQTQMARRGWDITADGVYGPATREVVIEFQTEKNLGADGEIGPITWAAAWNLPVT